MKKEVIRNFSEESNANKPSIVEVCLGVHHPKNNHYYCKNVSSKIYYALMRYAEVAHHEKHAEITWNRSVYM